MNGTLNKKLTILPVDKYFHFGLQLRGNLQGHTLFCFSFGCMNDSYSFCFMSYKIGLLIFRIQGSLV